MDYNLKMAIPVKRQLGTRLTWLGFNFYLSMGVLAITQEKVTRALTVIDSIISEAAPVDYQRSREGIGWLALRDVLYSDWRFVHYSHWVILPIDPGSLKFSIAHGKGFSHKAS